MNVLLAANVKFLLVDITSSISDVCYRK